jgi:hypothetical protein
MSSYYANIGSSDGTRDPVDRYETPDSVTEALLSRVGLYLPDHVREPACGTGRMTRVLERYGHEVHATDLVEDGLDFLDETEGCEAVVTNPPYRNGLALAFLKKALEVTDDGPVALLVRLGFLGTQERGSFLADHRPSGLIFISRRILFYKADGTRISGQAHDHCWAIWNVPMDHQVDFALPEELHDASR